MRIYQSNNLPALSSHEQELIYCATDAAVTLELYEKLSHVLGEATPVYEHARRLLAPYLTVMNRGIKIDTNELEKVKPKFKARIDTLTEWVRDMGEAIFGERPNEKIVNSPTQLKKLFYEALAIPTIYKREKGQRKVSLDRKALEKITKNYLRGVAPAKALLRLRDLQKTLGVLETGLKDGRWLCSYNLAGTETFRRSSSEHPLGLGSNAQNLHKDLRRLFIADDGYVMVQADQQQAEARDVAYLSGDENYIKATESGDLHTTVAAMVFGFEPKRELADRKFYREKSYRDITKNIQFGSNYDGTPSTLANLYGIEIPVIEDFQQRYHKGPKAAFPGIRKWQEATRAEVQQTGQLDTCFGYRRTFWGRLNDDATLREAIAFRPQNMTGARTSIAMWKLYWELEPVLQLLGEVHDAVLFQVPMTNVNLIDQAQEALITEVDVTDINGVVRTQRVPWEVQCGLNWKPVTDVKNDEGILIETKNPRGLR